MAHAYTAVIQIHSKTKINETYVNGRKNEETVEKGEVANIVIRASTIEALKAKVVAHVALVEDDV